MRNILAAVVVSAGLIACGDNTADNNDMDGTTDNSAVVGTASTADVESGITAMEGRISSARTNTLTADDQEKLDEAQEKLAEAREKLADGKTDEAQEKVEEAEEKYAEAFD